MSESNSDSELLGAGASTSSKSGDSSGASAGNPWRQEEPIPVPTFGSTFTLNNLWNLFSYLKGKQSGNPVGDRVIRPLVTSARPTKKAPSILTRNAPIASWDAPGPSNPWKRKPTPVIRPGDPFTNHVQNVYPPFAEENIAYRVRARVLAQVSDTVTFARPTKKSRTSRELKFLKPHDRSTAQSPFKGDSLPKPNPVLFERMHCLNERENNILVPYQWPTSSCLSSDESSDDLSTAEFLFGGGGRETETTSIASSTRDMLADGPTTRGLREMTQMPTGDPSVVTIPDFDSVEGIEEVDPISTEVSVPPRLKRKRFSTPNGETSVKVVSILSQTKPHFEQLPDQLTQAGPSKASVKHIEFKNKKPVSDYAGVEIKTKGTTSLQVLGTEDVIVTPSTKRTSLNSASVALQKKPQFEKLYGQSSQAETSESTPPVKDAELSEIKNAMIKGKKPISSNGSADGNDGLYSAPDVG